MSSSRFEQGPGRKESVYTVCAYNSVHKGTTDYVCDGVSDEVQIQAAIDACGSYGGVVKLLEGLYYISSPIELEQAVAIRGEGVQSTYIRLTAGTGCPIFQYTTASNIYFPEVSGMLLDGNKSSTTVGKAFDISSYVKDLLISRIFVTSFKDEGIYITNGWGCVLDNVVVEYCESHGVVCDTGGFVKIKGLKSISNEGHGVLITATTNPTHISDSHLNTIGAGYAGAYVSGHRAMFTGCAFMGSSVLGTYGAVTDGIKNGWMNCIFHGNSKNSYNLWLKSGGNQSIVIGNQFYGAVTLPILDEGSENIISDNYGSDETVTTGTPTLQTWGYTKLNSVGGAITATLPDGTYIGQRKHIVMSNSSNASTVSATHHVDGDPTVQTFDTVGDSWVLEWTGYDWITVTSYGLT